MKKTFLALMGIALIATTALIYSCNKEENETAKEKIVGTKLLPDTERRPGSWVDDFEKPFYPHFKYKYSNSLLEKCKESGPIYCGHDIDDILNGDEICFLWRKELDDKFWVDMYMPMEFLKKNQAEELVTCAENGEPMIFHDDFNVLSKELVEFLGTDMIPAGTYNTYVTSYKGEKMVCIEIGVIK